MGDQLSEAMSGSGFRRIARRPLRLAHTKINLPSVSPFHVSASPVNWLRLVPLPLSWRVPTRIHSLRLTKRRVREAVGYGYICEGKNEGLRCGPLTFLDTKGLVDDLLHRYDFIQQVIQASQNSLAVDSTIESSNPNQKWVFGFVAATVPPQRWRPKTRETLFRPRLETASQHRKLCWRQYSGSCSRQLNSYLLPALSNTISGNPAKPK